MLAEPILTVSVKGTMPTKAAVADDWPPNVVAMREWAAAFSSVILLWSAIDPVVSRARTSSMPDVFLLTTLVTDTVIEGIIIAMSDIGTVAETVDVTTLLLIIIDGDVGVAIAVNV